MGDLSISLQPQIMRVVLLLLVVADFASAEKFLYEESAPSMEGTEENLLSVVKELRRATDDTPFSVHGMRIEDHANLVQKARAYKHSFGARNALRAAIRALVSELSSGHNHDRSALNNERNAGHNAIRNSINRGKGVTRRYREKACPTKKAQVEAEAARNSAKSNMNSIKRRKICNLNTSWFDMNIKGAAPKFGGELRNKWDKARADYVRKLSKYNAAVRAYNNAAREHSGAMAAFKATVKAEASNAHAACRNAHKAYEILKKDVASNVSTRKQVYIASKVITCYIDNLQNNGGAKGCADRARRANTSRWNISAPKMNACLSKVALQAQLGPLSWRPSKRNCHANHWNERGIKEKATKERQSKERNSKERNNKERANKERANKKAAAERKQKNSWKSRNCSGMTIRGNAVSYRGYTYRVGNPANHVGPNTRGIGCDSSWYRKPAHYGVAPDNIDTRTVIKCFYWGTHVLVTNHKSYGTKGYSHGNLYSSHRYLGRSGNNVRTTGCNLRVIFRRHGHHHVHGKNTLHCATRTAASNNAGIVYAHVHSGYTMTGGGMNNRYRHWNARSAFEEMMPHGNTFRCDTGFGPGHVTCYNQHCKTTVGSLQCTTRSTYFAGSGVRVATLPGGYTMTGGGIYNHYRHFNAHSGFEESYPHGNNGWRGDMGFGWGQYTVYVRGCRSTVGTLSCVTRNSGVANYHSVGCPGGYKLTGCGISNHYRHFNHLSGFEQSQPHGNGCLCDSGFGSGRNQCFARCCKIIS